MKSLSNYILEKEDNVYVVYYDDGTMYNYYMTKEEADIESDKLNKENKDFPTTVKTEKKSSFVK